MLSAIRDFSVAMCVWRNDNPVLFDRALTSILEQSLLPIELILVVDGPITQKIENVILEFQEEAPRSDIEFVCIRLDSNIGHGGARNIAINKATTQFVAICDADDINEPSRFKKQYEYLNSNSDITLVGSQIYEQNLLGSNLAKSVRRVPLKHDVIVRYSGDRCPFNQMTVMFRREDILEVGGYQDFYHNEDYYLWFRLMLARKRLANLEDFLVTAHVDEKSFQRRGGLKYFRSEARIKQLFYRNGMLSLYRLCINILVRFVIQVLCPAKVRGFIFLRVLRENG